MMNQTLKNSEVNLKPGTVITGKWNKKSYHIHTCLGQGAIGSVYLAKQSDQKMVALKISDKTASITTEVNVLKSLAKVQGSTLGPSLFDVDDWIDRRGQCYPFYTMEYVRGNELRSFLRSRGDQWLGLLFIQLLEDLERLHQQGWVFGDLKIDNLIVASSPPKLRWIDVGGTTQIGRSIKEYTEFYDRGYWQAGSRKADPSYDLFALAMVALHYAYPNQFDRGSHPSKTLIEKVKSARLLAPYQECLRKALQGRYQSSEAMKKDLNKILLQSQSKREPVQNSRKRQRPITKFSSKLAWLESLIIFIIASLFWIIYYFI